METIKFEKKGVIFTIANEGYRLRITANAGQFLVVGDYDDFDDMKAGNVTLEGDVLKLESPMWFRMPDGVDGEGFIVSDEVLEWVNAQVITPEVSLEQRVKNAERQAAMSRIAEKPDWMDERQWVEDIFAAGDEVDQQLAAIARYDQRLREARKQAIESGEPVFVRATEHDYSTITYIGKTGWVMPDGSIDTRSFYGL